MYEKFTERARNVMRLATEEAHALGSEFVGTEHILLGIVKEGGGIAAKVLKNLNVRLARIEVEVKKRITPGDRSGPSPGAGPGIRPVPRRIPGSPWPTEPSLSPCAKRAIELAGTAASRLYHDVIGTEHLILGLLDEEESIAAQVLNGMGLKAADVRNAVLEVLGADVDPPGSSEGGRVQAQWHSAEIIVRQGKENVRKGKLQDLMGEIDEQLSHLLVEKDQRPQEEERASGMAEFRETARSLYCRWRTLGQIDTEKLRRLLDELAKLLDRIERWLKETGRYTNAHLHARRLFGHWARGLLEVDGLLARWMRAHGAELHDVELDLSALPRVLRAWPCACCGFPREEGPAP